MVAVEQMTLASRLRAEGMTFTPEPISLRTIGSGIVKAVLHRDGKSYVQYMDVPLAPGSGGRLHGAIRLTGGRIGDTLILEDYTHEDWADAAGALLADEGWTVEREIVVGPYPVRLTVGRPYFG